VANGNDATLSVIDYAAKKAIATLAVNVRNANRLKFTPNGKRVLVSSAADLVVVDAATREVVKRIQLGQFGHGAGGILVQPDGARAYVGLGPDNFVVVVDLRTLEVAGHLDVGGEPDGMAWAERR
jgi:YVTN family beta-propeller protein